jgi:hypothetical protein
MAEFQGVPLKGSPLVFTASVSANMPPSVSVISPLEDGSYLSGAVIMFTAVVGDVDGVVEKVEWHSDIDGFFGSGANTVFAGLRRGLHRITATATDNEGASSSAAINVEIVDATQAGRFAVTATRHAHGEDKVAICRQTFGAAFTIADWNDVKNAIGAGVSPEDIVPSAVGHAWGLRGGSAYWVYPRHYIISSVIHSGYLIHDSIGNVMWLGSWDAEYPILCFRST